MKMKLLASVAIVAATLSSANVLAKDIVMVAPVIPPHFDSEGNGRIGDVVAAVMRHCGHKVAFRMVPFGRHWAEYKDGKFDALATAEGGQTFSGYSTKPFIHLQDVATVVVGRGLDGASKPEDFAGKHIVSFPGAQQILGLEPILSRFASFKNRSKRFDQVRPLLAGRADAIFADGLITAHFLQVLRERGASGQEPDVDTKLKTVFRRIFSKGPQRLYFRDKSLADEFDRCHQELEATGKLDDIAKPYVDRFRAVVGDQYPVR